MLIRGKNDLASKYPDLLKDWHSTKNGLLEPQNVTYASDKMVWWKCHVCGYEWESKISNRTCNNRGCPICKRKSAKKKYIENIIEKNGSFGDKYPELVAEWNYERNNGKTPFNVTAGSNKQVWWKCKFGHEWKTSPANRSKGCSCKYCAGTRILPGFNDLETLRPDLLKEWDYDKNKILPSQVGIGSVKKVWWKCKNGHSYDCGVRSRVAEGVECRYCKHQAVIVGQNDFATLYPDLLKEWDFEKNALSPNKIFPKTSQKIWWKCPLGHSYQKTMNHKVGRQDNCPICSREIKCSFPEQALLYYIKKYFPDAVSGSREFGFELDIFIPSIKTAIEYDGAFWHQNSRTHTVKTEQIKNWECKKRKIQFIRVREPGINSDYSDYCKIVSREDYTTDKSLEKVIAEVLAILGIKELDIAVDCDRIKIYNEYILIRKNNNLAIAFPNIAKEWNYEKNGELIPEMFVANSNKKVWWKCVQGHEWQAAIAHRTSRNDGCPYCGNRRVLVGYNDLATCNPELLSEWDEERNTIRPCEVVPGSSKMVFWICPCGHSYKKAVRERTGIKGRGGCPYCRKT